jgi:PTH1 family peptidyl-tRNA hydrolase
MNMNNKINSFKLIIGLGNPDKKYENTYHNVGFLALDYFAKNPPITNYQLPITKSNAYMNESGIFVAKMIKKFSIKPQELLIIHDDSDIELGKYKLSFSRGSAGHKGVESIIKAIGTKNFWRLRIGIRSKDLRFKIQDSRKKAGEFVLKNISEADQEILEKVFRECSLEL